MATQADVRRIALSLPEVEEASDRFALTAADLERLIAEEWRCQTPVDLASRPARKRQRRS